MRVLQPVRRLRGRPSPSAGRVGPPELVPGSAGFVAGTFLRYGITPFLVLGDVVAWLLCAAPGGVVGGELVLLAGAVSLYAAAGLYRSRLTLSALDDLPALAGRALAAGALTTSAALLVGSDADGRSLLATAGGMAGLVVVVRAVGYWLVRAVRVHGWINHPTLVLGAGRVGGQLATALAARREHGLRPIGFLDGDPLLPEQERPVPLLGGTDALSSVIVEFGVQDVIVAFSSLRESQMVDILRTCDRLDVEIFFVPRLFELHHTSRDMDQVWGVPLVRQRRAAFRSPSWRLKRVLDVAVSGVALLVLAPLLALIAVAVRCEGGPGVLFRQERVGLDGRSFSLLKFRSLKPADETESATNWNIALDDRLGPVGRFLRSTSLDELPQLWNILNGDMTLVGPRPERPHFVAAFAQRFPRYTARHRVPSGLTGWAQVHGLRGDTSIEDRARFDNYYIENWSLWADIKIVLRTVLAVLRRTGG